MSDFVIINVDSDSKRYCRARINGFYGYRFVGGVESDKLEIKSNSDELSDRIDFLTKIRSFFKANDNVLGDRVDSDLKLLFRDFNLCLSKGAYFHTIKYETFDKLIKKLKYQSGVELTYRPESDLIAFGKELADTVTRENLNLTNYLENWSKQPNNLVNSMRSSFFYNRALSQQVKEDLERNGLLGEVMIATKGRKEVSDAYAVEKEVRKLIKDGVISSNDEVLKRFEEAGYIVERQNSSPKNKLPYVTLRKEGEDNSFRLSGTMYGRNFNAKEALPPQEIRNEEGAPATQPSLELGIKNADLSSFTVIDIECNGNGTDDGEIIEIAALKMRGSVITETFQILIQSETPILERCRKIHGITDEMLKGCVEPERAIIKLASFLDDDNVIVGSNVKTADLRLLDRDAKRYGYPQLFSNTRYVDIVDVARLIHPEFENHKLDTLIEKLNVKPRGSLHRALWDCFAEAEVFLKLKGKAERLGKIDRFQIKKF